MAEKRKLLPDERHVSAPYPPGKQKKSVSFQASPFDLRIIEEICECLGVGRGEAVRTALRVYHTILTRNQPSGERRTASALLFGPPGTSKTTVVQGVAQALRREYPAREMVLATIGLFETNLSMGWPPADDRVATTVRAAMDAFEHEMPEEVREARVLEAARHDEEVLRAASVWFRAFLHQTDDTDYAGEILVLLDHAARSAGFSTPLSQVADLAASAAPVRGVYSGFLARPIWHEAADIRTRALASGLDRAATGPRPCDVASIVTPI